MYNSLRVNAYNIFTETKIVILLIVGIIFINGTIGSIIFSMYNNLDYIVYMNKNMVNEFIRPIVGGRNLNSA